MRRFTILSLMGLVLVLAVGIAALRGANDYWSGGLLLAVPLLLLIALIGALCGKERSRAGRLGFAIMGGGYFALAFLGLSDGNLNKVPTSKLLYMVHERVAPSQTFTVSLALLSASGFPTPPTTAVISNAAPAPAANPVMTQYVTTTTNSSVATPETIPPPPNRWKAMLPGAADLACFSAVGHCLFALLAGLLGAVIARRFERGWAAQ